MSPEELAKDSSTQPSRENPARKRPVSERKIQANRTNALSSTGPKTARGKMTVARNAIKHGVLTREVVITAGDGKENLEEFHALVEGLWESYQPMGFLEESRVQAIAACWWRKARVIRAENGEVRQRLDRLAERQELRNSEKINDDVKTLQFHAMHEATTDQTVSTRDRSSALQRAQNNLWTHHLGLEYLSDLLEEAKSEIASDGYMSEEIRDSIFFAFCSQDSSFAFACANAGPPELEMEDQPSEKVLDKKTVEERSQVVALIDQQLERIGLFKDEALEREKLAVDAKARSFSLPPEDATDKLLRYESHLDRQLYRAMDQLERLQRQRSGENVPPPLNVNLSRRN